MKSLSFAIAGKTITFGREYANVWATGCASLSIYMGSHSEEVLILMRTTNCWHLLDGPSLAQD